MRLLELVTKVRNPVTGEDEETGLSLFELHKNQCGKGIPKFMSNHPFGSGSANLQSVLTASYASYAATASAAIRVYTASKAITGVAGVNGSDGICIYVQGPQGATGSKGPTGAPGGISDAF